MRFLLACMATLLMWCGNGVKTMTKPAITCSSMADCLAHDGERVTIEATYRVWDPLPIRHKDQPPAQQVMLWFADQEGPFLGAWGHAGHMRPLDEIARLDGKRVQVVGTFRKKMPPHPTDPPEAASVDGPCVHPVEHITPLP